MNGQLVLSCVIWNCVLRRLLSAGVPGCVKGSLGEVGGYLQGSVSPVTTPSSLSAVAQVTVCHC